MFYYDWFYDAEIFGTNKKYPEANVHFGGFPPSEKPVLQRLHPPLAAHFWQLLEQAKQTLFELR